jgi:hypothetical protein
MIDDDGLELEPIERHLELLDWQLELIGGIDDVLDAPDLETRVEQLAANQLVIARILSEILSPETAAISTTS